jgi:hypothetical protein
MRVPGGMRRPALPVPVPGRPRPHASRPWTRIGIAGTAAHVFYELGCGVGMPLASRVGPGPAAALWAAGTLTTYREAARRPSSDDRVFAVLNGLFASAVVAHFSTWPTTRIGGLPWLRECEGISGAAVQPYNVILHVSAVAAVGGLLENRHGRIAGVLLPIALVPLLRRAQRSEFDGLRRQARERPGWWNRRLRARAGVLAEPR